MGLVASGCCDGVLAAFALCQTQACARSIMIFWMTMPALGSRTLSVHIILSTSSISSRMAGARFLARLVVNRSLWGDSACNVQGNVTQSYVCGASVSDALGLH